MSPNPIRVLLVEEGDRCAFPVRQRLEEDKGGEWAVEWADSISKAFKQMAEGLIDIVLLDISPAGGRGLENLKDLLNVAPHIPIIVLSSVDDEALAIKAMHEGAQDYLVKDQLDYQLLVRSIHYSIERKQAEMALIHAEEKYRSIFENTVEGIFQTSPEGRYISANPALARIYGYDSPEEVIASLINIEKQLYVDPNRRVEFVRLMQLQDVVTNFESRIYRKDRSIICISENVRAVRDSQGNLLYYEGTVEDITERKSAEEKIRDSENLYHSLVENLPQHIFRKDLSERFTFANQRFCQSLGKPLEQIIGKTDFDFFPPELAAKYQQDDRLILETGKIFETIEEHQPPGSEKLYVNVVKTPLYDSQGKIAGLQGIFWDITEKKRAEERAKRANAELAKSREELRVKNEEIQEDLRMAREFQLAILPQQYPNFPRGAQPENSAIQFCHRYFPTGAVGGDFFNILALSDTQVGVFICDVMGHGVRSALVTAIMRALVEELTPLAQEPDKLLAQCNRDLRAILKQTGTPLFTTAFYLVVDLERKQISYANAGHPKPLLIRRNKKEVEQLGNVDGISRPALGLFDETTYKSSSCSISEEDLIMLFTDGLYDVEYRHEQLFSGEWLVEAVTKRMQFPAQDLFDDLLGEIRTSSLDGEFTDDVCIVGIEVCPRKG